MTAIAIGLVALVLSWMMRLQLGFPENDVLFRGLRLLSVHHHARHDHGDLPAYRAVPGRLRQLPDPADGRRAGHGLPLLEHGQLLGLSARRSDLGGELLRAGRADRRRLDALPAAGDPRRHSGLGRRNRYDGRLALAVHRRVHHGRLELRGDGLAGAHAGHVADAHAVDGMGYLRRHDPGSAGLPRPVRRRGDDDTGRRARNQLLHAVDRGPGRATRLRWRQPAAVPALVLVLRPSGSLHRRAARLRHRLRLAERPREKEHLRLSNDGVGDRLHRRAQLLWYGRTICMSAA